MGAAFKNFILLGKADTAPIIAELDAAPEMWLADTSRQRKVRCQRHTQNIYLRAARKPLPPGAKNANDVHESRVLRSAARFPKTLQLCERIARQQGALLGRAALVALLPQSRVYPHVDHGAYYRIRDRYHIVLKSAQGSPLTAGDETVVMREGELWGLQQQGQALGAKPVCRTANSPDLRRSPRRWGRILHLCPGGRSEDRLTATTAPRPARDGSEESEDFQPLRKVSRVSVP